MLERLRQQKFNNQLSSEVLSDLLKIFRKRKTTRHFSEKQVDIDIILKAIEIAGTAPSGANKQPWTFAVIEDNDTKKLIQQKAESEEREFYSKEATKNWVEDLKPLHTGPKKDFLTKSAYLIPVFFKNYELAEENNKSVNYYAKESTCIATGFLVAALHLAGLSTLTYTPTNRKFLVNLLNRPKNENAMMVIAVGLPAENSTAPILSKKMLSEISAIYSDVKERKPILKTNT